MEHYTDYTKVSQVPRLHFHTLVANAFVFLSPSGKIAIETRPHFTSTMLVYANDGHGIAIFGASCICSFRRCVSAFSPVP